jgi:UDP-glucose 4-epimerase
MFVLVTGASGFVGNAFCAQLKTLGISYRAVIRRESQVSYHSDYILIDSIDGQTDWKKALDGITVVVHLAARVHVMNEISKDPLGEFRKVNVEGSVNLANHAVLAGINRFIYISSVKVNGEGRNTPYLESDLPGPQDAYAVSKCEAERGLWAISEETGMEVVILRIPLVYGPGVGANFFQLLKIIDQGWPLPLSGINNKRSLLYVGNLINAILCVLQHPRAANQLFLLSDGQDASTSQLVTSLAQALGKQTRMFPVSERLLRSVAGVVGKSSVVDRLFGSLHLDSTKIHRELGWSPPFTLQDGLQATAKWYRTL